jgi:integrase
MPVSITARKRRSGTRYVVRYRLGGRFYPLIHAGSFRMLKDARTRRDLVAGEIAAGRDPTGLLTAIVAVPEAVVPVSEWRGRFLASRIDVDENTIRNYRTALTKACERFGDIDPSAIGWQDVAEWVADLAQTYKPGTVRLYKTLFAVLLDYIGLDPNPAKDARVKVPKRVSEEPNPPTAEHFLAVLDAVPQVPRRILFLVMEQGALRLGEAVGLRWGDVDRVGLRLRLPKSQTKRDRARWVYLPEWLMDALETLCPLEDRTPERRVFQASPRHPRTRR